MAERKPHKDHKITVKELYPNLNEEELEEAEDTLDRYIDLAVRMYKRIKADPEAHAEFIALTDERRASRMKTTPSNMPNSSQT